MNKIRSTKGITLIALIVTIIVLIILAAVTIYALTGENNIIEDVKNAKEVSRRAEAEEIMELKLANLYAHDYIKPKRTLDLQEIANALCDDEDIEYVIKKNKETASLEYIDVSDVKSIYTKLKAYPYEFEIGEKLRIESVRNTEGEAGGETKPIDPSEKTYLVDKVEIGAYVDIGIDYENKQSFQSAGEMVTKSPLTGWRVLSKSGSGETGQIKLISAGCPLVYWNHTSYLKENIGILEDLYNTIPVGVVSSAYTYGIFTENGFGDDNLQNIFTEEKHIDTSKGIHAFGCGAHDSTNKGIKATKYLPLNEAEELYKSITGNSIDTFWEYSVSVNNNALKNLAGENWSDRYNDLFVNGSSYCLGGASYNEKYLGAIHGNAVKNYLTSSGNVGVRPVITLKPGVILIQDDKSDGNSKETAYKIN